MYIHVITFVSCIYRAQTMSGSSRSPGIPGGIHGAGMKNGRQTPGSRATSTNKGSIPKLQVQPGTPVPHHPRDTPISQQTLHPVPEEKLPLIIPSTQANNGASTVPQGAGRFVPTSNIKTEHQSSTEVSFRNLSIVKQGL